VRLKQSDLYSESDLLFRRGASVQEVARALRISQSHAEWLKRVRLEKHRDADRYYRGELEKDLARQRKETVAWVLQRHKEQLKAAADRLLEECKERQEEERLDRILLAAEKHTDTIFRLFPAVQEITVLLPDGSFLTRSADTL